MVASNNFGLKLACLPLAVVLGVFAGRGNDPSTPTAPTAQFGSVTGLLRGEAPMLGRIPPRPHLSNATVTVLGGPASDTKSTIGADGTYQLTAAGTFKLRFEPPSFVTSESAETVMTPNGITIPEVILVTAPWTIFGSIGDSLGNAVPDAEVTVARAEFSELGGVRTDAASFIRRSPRAY